MCAVALQREDNTERILLSALQCMRQRFGFDVAFVSEFRDGRRFFRHVDAAHGASSAQIAGRSDPLEATYCQRIVDGRLPAVLPDSSVDAALVALPATSELGIAGHAGAAIRFSDGRVYGTLCCYSHAPMPTLSAPHAEAVQLLADFLSLILENESSGRQAAESTLQRISGVLEDRSFFPVFQPIVDIRGDRIVGYEALTRFTAEPPRPPNVWFSEAGQVGLQPQLEMAAARRALESLPALPAGVYLAVNLSPRTLLAGDLAGAFDGVPLDRVVVEITEHDVVEDYSEVSAALSPLRDQGLRLAVDDAGAGFASFRHILMLRPDVIKIDSSLVQRIDVDAGSRALAAALVRFADSTGSDVVAEGIETREQLGALRELQVDRGQGYLLGKPQPLAHLQRAVPRLED